MAEEKSWEHGDTGPDPDFDPYPDPDPDPEFDPDFDGLVLDEAFVRAADTAEPSARARMLAARWRRENPEPQPWRSDEPPAGWFFSKVRRRRWRGRRR